ncbi:putative PAS/PAC sensor protein [Ignisphaera aggregans DSM 17230]|uniref:Putative PAS/PAC sensor protein n=1 Tax=Ignisphaera aggregans (strain DSM 17230 / JCM 13409 / AQ1.S1) TaxID=583356 RepID=E0SQS0_IGNAA|nr:putative PAS/PAC sensor protein [Ignisphaera aggregans DSM 17230]
MSNLDMNKKIGIIKELLKQIHRGISVEELKTKYSQVLMQISPIEIPLIEQQLVKEGISIDEILKLCDLHVALFRDYLVGRELKDIPNGHPLDILVKENDEILKLSEALGMYITSISIESDHNKLNELYSKAFELAEKLYRASRIHYQKLQMVVFPYLERFGIYAVPRVLWGRENEAITKIRRLRELLRNRGMVNEIVEIGKAVVSDVSELIFRESKILYPAIWSIFSEGIWKAIYEEFKEIGFAIKIDSIWETHENPIYPWQIEKGLDEQTIERLPSEIKTVALSLQQGLKFDAFKLIRDGYIDLDTGYVNVDEIKGIFRGIPIELTFADKDGRVRFYTKNRFMKGFARVKTLLGRKLEYCHPPKLEPTIKKIFEDLKNGARDYYEFYSVIGGRIVRVLAIAIRNDRGEFLGALEVVEDITEFVEKPEEIKKRIMIL